MAQRTRILLAEDDFDVREALVAVLEAGGFEVIDFGDGRGIESYIDESVVLDLPHKRARAVLTDLRMPGCSGFDLLCQLDALGGPLPAVVLTAFGDPGTRRRAEDLGAIAVLDKPVDPDALVALLRRVVRDTEG